MSDKMNNKKTEIANAITKYVSDGIFDISKFRTENPKLYAKIQYHFGGVDNVLDELGLVRVQKSKQKNRITFRNMLAYDRLKELREKYTLEEIGKIYGVTRASVNQLYQALEIAVKSDKIENQIDELDEEQ